MTGEEKGSSALKALLLAAPLDELMATASAQRDEGHGRVQSWSRKIFIPLTQLCRNLCHYCTFSQPPRPGENAYMTREEVLKVARPGKAAGCTEALFTLGDKPELRFSAESISRAAGTQHGQEMSLAAMEALIRSIGRVPLQRSTAYGQVTQDMHDRGMSAAELTSMGQTPPRKRGRDAAPKLERFEYAE